MYLVSGSPHPAPGTHLDALAASVGPSCTHCTLGSQQAPYPPGPWVSCPIGARNDQCGSSVNCEALNRLKISSMQTWTCPQLSFLSNMLMLKAGARGTGFGWTLWPHPHPRLCRLPLLQAEPERVAAWGKIWSQKKRLCLEAEFPRVVFKNL